MEKESDRHGMRLCLSRPAMQALLGSDPNLCLEISRQVLAKMQVSALAETKDLPEIKAMLEDIDSRLSDEFMKLFSVEQGCSWNYVSATLTPAVSAKIDQFIQKSVTDATDLLIRKYFDEAVLHIDEKIAWRVDYLVGQMVRTRVEKAFKEIMEKAKESIT